MTKYKLLKCLPNAVAGKICEGTRDFVDITDKRGETYRYHKEYVENFDSWFEEIKQPTNSIHWKPKKGEMYYYGNGTMNINLCAWVGGILDTHRYDLGNIYRTKAEYKKATDRQKAITTLQRSSDFVPNWSNHLQKKWCVTYNHASQKLCWSTELKYDIGAPVYFAGYEDTEASVKNHRREWLLFFGVEED